MDKPIMVPGTVSKILWHFPGGPARDEETSEQVGEPKTAAEAYEILVKIVSSKLLRVGEKKESINVVGDDLEPLPGTRGVAHKVKRARFKSNHVCCLADIPIMHLGYHAYRYGKTALGFHRHAAISNGFNPVFYQPENSHVLRAMYKSLCDMEASDPHEIRSLLLEATEDLKEAAKKSRSEPMKEFVGDLLNVLNLEATKAAIWFESAKKQMAVFLAFVKTFPESEFGTIYCEREWRATTPWNFCYEDLAMIVLPKKDDEGNFFGRFINEWVSQEEFLRAVPVVPWEDLVEH